MADLGVGANPSSSLHMSEFTTYLRHNLGHAYDMTTTRTLALAAARALRPDQRRMIREAAGLTLGDVARGIGCTASAVRLWERGTREPSGTLGERYGLLLRDLDRLQQNLGEATP